MVGAYGSVAEALSGALAQNPLAKSASLMGHCKTLVGIVLLLICDRFISLEGETALVVLG
jgi:hypothetical protein